VYVGQQMDVYLKAATLSQSVHFEANGSDTELPFEETSAVK